ncbi:MAG TPA: NnrU family protein [Hyphomicrobiaceae bacterium]|nr:NnrU family protein [Hyphomicrobiaceae bacterium]
MLTLIIGLALFFLIHLVPTRPELRRGLVERFGEGGYKIGFSLISAVALVLIVFGYGKLQGAPGKNPELWVAPIWARHVALALMLPAFVLLAAAYIPSRIRSAVQHPMLAAVKIWALAHLFANGDLASVALFGGFLAFAAYDRMSVARRGARGPLGERKGGLAQDLIAVAIGVGLYLFMLLFGHAWLIGVPLLPGWT